jgi:hypothetical protein
VVARGATFNGRTRMYRPERSIQAETPEPVVLLQAETPEPAALLE